jgi:tetratricopeptide (TPR) repeat protein
VLAAGCNPQRLHRPKPHSKAFQQGQRLYLKGDYDAAATCFRQHIDKHPHTVRPEMQYWLGRSLLNQSRYAEAETVFRKCLENGPSPALKLRAWVGIGDCYRLEHQDELAAEVYGRVLKTGSVEVQRDRLLFHRGMCLLRTARKEDGRKALQKYLRKYPASQWREAARQALGKAGGETAE